MKRTKFNPVLIASAILLVNFTSCKKYEDGPAISFKSKKARLTGDWVVTDKPDELEGEDFDEIEEISFEFEKDGDFKFTTTYVYDDGYTYRYAYRGDWEWDEGKKEIEIEFEDQTVEFEILRLTNKEFWFKSDFGFGDEELWKCEKE